MGLLFKSAIAIAVVALLGYAVTTMPLPFVNSWWERGFTPHRDSPLNVRHRMADGLVMTHALVGNHRETVARQLGPPLAPPYDSLSTPSSDMVYYLGPERGFIGIDSEWLIVRFGSDARVSRIVVRSD